MKDRHPPNNPEAEETLIGIALQDCNRVPDLKPSLFYDLRHRTLAESMQVMSGRGEPVDSVTVFSRCKGTVPDVATLISSCMDKAVTGTSWNHFSKQLAEHAALRSVIKFGIESAELAFDTEPGDAGQLLDTVERDALAIRRTITGDTASESDSKTLLNELLDDYQAAFDGTAPSGLLTGFSSLDWMTGTLKPQQLFIIAARPSVGKTALALNIACNVAIAGNEPVAFFSLEMSAKELLHRAICSHGRIDSTVLRMGKLTQGDFSKLTMARGALAKAPLHICDKGGLTIAQLTGLARRMVQRHHVKLIVVDYLGLLRSGEKAKSRYEETTAISIGLKAMAKELNVPVIALAQLNRDSERESRPPRLSDLRDSGSVEQDADLVALLHRNESDDGDTQPVDLILAKQRNGQTGKIPLLFHKAFTRFESASNPYLN